MKLARGLVRSPDPLGGTTGSATGSLKLEDGQLSMKHQKKFRVGQKVQSINDATHVFVIDKSQVPERIYHEKGPDRWWTRNELQRLGAPENPATSIRLNGKGKMRGMHPNPNASPGISGGPQIVAENSVGLEKRKCLGCEVRLRPTRRWQKFHSEVCRRAYWKRRIPAPKTEQTRCAAV
jgi:hypothetical protein